MKKILTAIAVLLVIAALPVAIYLVGQRQELRKKAAPATTLSVTPSSVTNAVGDTFSLEISIDTGDNQVVAGEIHVLYDPTILEAQTITNGALFPNILSSGVIDQGEATITVGAMDATHPVSGTGAVAVVRFLALVKTDSSPTTVKIGQNTFVGGLGEGATNVLVATTPAAVSIVDSQEAQPPSPSPTQTPSPPLEQEELAAPTPTPTPSKLLIVSPEIGSSTTQTTPPINGKAPAGATVVLTINSTPVTATVVADEYGNWSYTPDVPLEPGPHNVTATFTDDLGQQQEATVAFVVASTNKTGAGDVTDVPVSGAAEATIVLVGVGILFLFLGVISGQNLWLSH